MSSQYAPRARPTTPSLSPRSIFCLCRDIRLSLGSIRRKRPSAHLPLFCSSLRNLGLSCLFLAGSSFSSAPGWGGTREQRLLRVPAPLALGQELPTSSLSLESSNPRAWAQDASLGARGASDLGRGLRLQGANCPPAPHRPSLLFLPGTPVNHSTVLAASKS